MGTILRNSLWHEKTETKRGDYGEECVYKILDQCGFVVYQARTDKAHSHDFSVELNKKLLFTVEVKTKSMMRKYRETGIDYKKYIEYRELCVQTRVPLLLIFVDPSKKKIYGNFLHVLEEPRIQDGIKYPKTKAPVRNKTGDLIRYYPEDAMLDIGTLTDDDVAELEKYNKSLYGKKTKIKTGQLPLF